MVRLGLNVYLIDTSLLKKSELFNQCYSLIPLDRQKKVDSFRFEEGKLLSLGAGLMLRQACIDSGLNPKEEVVVLPTGKPEFQHNKNLHFSISHSGKYAMCVISDCNIGCDIQIIENPRLNIANRFFSEEENKQLEQCTTLQEKEALFFKLWTLKESFVKAVGKGIDDDFKKFSILYGQSISIKQCFNQNNYSFVNLDLVKEYCASICIECIETSDNVQISNHFYLTEERIVNL